MKYEDLKIDDIILTRTPNRSNWICIERVVRIERGYAYGKFMEYHILKDEFSDEILDETPLYHDDIILSLDEYENDEVFSKYKDKIKILINKFFSIQENVVLGRKLKLKLLNNEN